MNLRIDEGESPEDRLAAVVRTLELKIEEKYRKTGAGPSKPDYADYRDALAPYVRRELLHARIDEARKSSAIALTTRMKELAAQLAECEKLIPKDEQR